jgi:hypothetical protein
MATAKKTTPAKTVKAAAPAAKAAKPAAPPAKAAAKPVKAAPLAAAFAEPKADKQPKPKKPKLVRDSFTIPKAEYAVLDELKQRAAKLARPAKKSEVLRAGIKALAALPDSAFLAALGGVPTIKTGRPAKD